jgi:DNA polymerase sigma
VDFLYYFGFYYDYQYEINQNTNKMIYRYELNSEQDSDPYLMALHILDPINPTNNVGTSLLI